MNKDIRYLKAIIRNIEMAESFIDSLTEESKEEFEKGFTNDTMSMLIESKGNVKEMLHLKLDSGAAKRYSINQKIKERKYERAGLARCSRAS